MHKLIVLPSVCYEKQMFVIQNTAKCTIDGYGGAVTRQQDPTIKPALLEQVIDHLLDKPLATLTFRGLATALGVSSFTLVYHFGTRDDLLRDIIDAIASRQRGFETAFDPETVTLASYVEGLRKTFERSLKPRNVALQRREFEAEMLEVASDSHSRARVAHQDLHDRGTTTLIALGLDPEDAAAEAQLLLDTFYGIQVSLVVSGDKARARRSFDRALRNHVAAIEPSA